MKTSIATKTKAVSVKLSEETRSNLDTVAKFQNRTVHYLMKQAVDSFVEKQLAEIALINEAKKAAAEMDETGLHLSFDEFDAWVDAFQEDSNAQLPACHK